MRLKQKSKILSILLTVCMVIGIIPMTAAAESETAVSTKGTVASFDTLPEEIVWQNYDMGGVTLADLTLPDSLNGTDADGNHLTIEEVTWQSDLLFEPEISQTYEFNPVLPDNYTLEEGATPPVIFVCIRSAENAESEAEDSSESDVESEAKDSSGSDVESEAEDGAVGGAESVIESRMLVASGSKMEIGGQSGVDLSSNQSGMGWVWKADTNTLTLSSSYNGNGIYIECDPSDHINLSLDGDVTIHSTSWGINVAGIDGNYGGKLTIKAGSHTLNVSGAGDSLQAHGGLTIESGTIVTTGGNHGMASYNGDVIITGSANVTSTGTGWGSGIQADRNIVISTSGTVQLTGDLCGVNAVSGEVTISSGTVTVDGNQYEALVSATGVNITGGKVSTGSTNGNVRGSLSVSGAATQVTVNGDITRNIYVIKNPGDLTVTGGIVTVTGTVEGTITATDGTVTVNGIRVHSTPVTGVVLDNSQLSLYSNIAPNTAKLTATVSPAAATDQSLTWKSSNSAVATVDSSGNVKAVGNGTSVITVTTSDGGYTATCMVTVTTNNIAVTKVSLSKTSMNLKVGEKGTLSTQITPSNATNQGISWSSSNKDIVTVDQTGNLSAKGIGTVTITAASASNSSVSASCTVNVSIGKVTGLTAKTNKTTSITLTWEKQNNVSGYEVYRYNGKKYEKIATIKKASTTTYTDKKRTVATTYQYKVRAYTTVKKKNVYGSYSAVLKTATASVNPVISVKAGSKKATLSWNKVRGVSGYEIYMSTKKSSGYEKIKMASAKTTKYTKTKLTKGKTYYFKIRTYKTVGGVKIYSSYSSIKQIKAK